MAYWLLKSEPETYSYEDLIRDKTGRWDGVRNYQARNNIRDMKPGDKALFYYSGKNPQVIAEIKIASEPYPDPTIDDPRWLCVDVQAHKLLKNPVTLTEIKANPACADLLLIRHTRLSVMPVDPVVYEAILEMSKGR